MDQHPTREDTRCKCTVKWQSCPYNMLRSPGCRLCSRFIPLWLLRTKELSCSLWEGMQPFLMVVTQPIQGKNTSPCTLWDCAVPALCRGVTFAPWFFPLRTALYSHCTVAADHTFWTQEKNKHIIIRIIECWKESCLQHSVQIKISISTIIWEVSAVTRACSASQSAIWPKHLQKL